MDPQPTPPTPAAPTPPAAPAPDAADQLMSSLFPVDAPQPAPQPGPQPAPQPTPQPGPVPAADDFEDLSWLTAPPKGAPTPAPQPGPTPPQPGPAPAAPTPPAAPSSDWSLERFLQEKIANPEELFTDARKIDQFRDLRGLFEAAAKENQALQLEIAGLRNAPPSAVAADPSAVPMPETEAIETLRKQIAELEPAAKSWQAEEARRNLRNNPAFRREFDGPRSAIMRELTATSTEIGLEEKDLQEFLQLDSEYKQARWIGENLDDAAAQGIFKEKGRNFLNLTKESESVLNSADPFAALREWEDYEAAFSTQVAVRLDESIARQFQSAGARVIEKLTSEDGDQYFRTDAGKSALGAIQKRFSDGVGVPPEELVEALAHRSRADAYQALSERLVKRLGEVEKEVGRLRGMDPGFRMLNAPTPSHGHGQPQVGIDPLASFDEPSQGVKPLVSQEALAAALAQTHHS